LSSSAPFVSPSGTVKGSRLTTYRLVQIIGATSDLSFEFRDRRDLQQPVLHNQELGQQD